MKVSIAFNSCPYEYQTIRPIIEHVLKQCKYDFHEVIVYSDSTINWQGKYSGIGCDEKEYRDILTKMYADMIINRIVIIDDIDPSIRNTIWDGMTEKSHNGSPSHNYACSMLLPDADYILRMDCDMVFHVDQSYNWIEEGIKYLEDHKDTMFYMVHPGPYTKDKRKVRSVRSSVIVQDDVLKYQTMTTRYFLFKKERFLNLCPFTVSRKDQRFEVALGEMLKQNNMYRVCSNNEKAWHIHTNAAKIGLDKTRRVIERVEKNHVPNDQIGEYNLRGNW